MWSVGVVAKALILERARFICPACVVATRPGLLLELTDAVSSGTAPPTALETVIATFCRVNNSKQRPKRTGLSLQEAAATAYSLQLMAGSIPTMQMFVRQPDGGTTRLTSKTIAKQLQGFVEEEVGRQSSGTKTKKKETPAKKKGAKRTSATPSKATPSKKKRAKSAK